MAHLFRSSLESAISTARMESYRNGGDDLAMIVNYFHNLELSEALYPSLQALEVTFRNSLHDSLTARYGTPYWFDHPDFAHSRQHVKSVAGIRNDLHREGISPPYSADHIVSRLSFGFWHGLLNRPFEATLWRANSGAMITAVFPNSPRWVRNRQALAGRVNYIRILRNRVMHYEPIWTRPGLQNDHRQVLETLGWISPDMASAITLSDRFPAVFTHGRHAVEQRVLAEIQRM